MRIGPNILNWFFKGYVPKMGKGRVIFKTIVSTELELKYVLMNIVESLELVDYFLVCEANYSVLGEKRDFIFEKLMTQIPLLNNPKIVYVKEELDDVIVPWANDKSNLFHNAFMIRDGFRAKFPMYENDIIVSTDGDEVLFSKYVKKYVKKLRRKVLPRMGYQLRLHQIVFKLNYLWKDCDFRAPVISRAKIFLDQEFPQWRDNGTSVLKKMGTHFSWVMTTEQIYDKILTTAHRTEYEEFANKELIEQAIKIPKWIFQPNRKFTIERINNLESKYFPKSISIFSNLFENEVMF